jgi:ribosomal protein L37AE/L43A
MAYPFSYTGNIVYFSKEPISLQGLEAQVLQIGKPSGERINSFYFPKGFLGLPFRFSYLLKKGKLSYTMNLFEVNMVTLIGVVMGVFFYGFHHYYAAAFTFVLVFLWYIVALVVNGFRLQSFLIGAIERVNGNTDSKEWANQQEWMKNPDLCPACGEPVNPYSNQCVDCGLHFKKGKKKEKYTATNSTGVTLVNYKTKGKNEKNSR